MMIKIHNKKPKIYSYNEMLQVPGIYEFYYPNKPDFRLPDYIIWNLGPVAFYTCDNRVGIIPSCWGSLFFIRKTESVQLVCSND